MRTIEIDGLFNVRSSSAAAPWLVRSGAPEALTDSGADALRRLGVTMIIDLREGDEAGVSTHGIQVVSVPLYGETAPATGHLEDVYESLLRDRGTALAAAVGAVADADGAVLVHCTAGKDRTGLVVALARLAAGHDASDVIDDYVLSGATVRPIREPHALAIAEGQPATLRAQTLRLHLDSPREAMVHALDVIDRLGGAPRYLLDNGLDEQQLHRLRAKGSARRNGAEA